MAMIRQSESTSDTSGTIIKLVEKFDVTALQQVAGSGVLEPADRKRVLAYLTEGIRGAARMGIHGVGGATGAVEVAYVRAASLGRLTATAAALGHGAITMTSMNRATRGWAARLHYVDVDMVNTQPTLALQLLERIGGGASTHHLAQYVRRREELLDAVATACSVARDDAKELFLRVCFGGTMEGWMRSHGVDAGRCGSSDAIQFVSGLQTEMKTGMAEVVAHHPDGPTAKQQQVERNPGAPNPLATQFAYILQDAERRCLEALLAAVRASGREVGALIHDGLHVERIDGDGDMMPPALLREWETAVEVTTGFKVALAVKPWTLDPAYMPGGAVVERDADNNGADDGTNNGTNYGISNDETALSVVAAGRAAAPDGGAIVPYRTSTLNEEDATAVRGALGLPDDARCREWRCDAVPKSKTRTSAIAVASAAGAGAANASDAYARLTAVGCKQCLVAPTHTHRSWSHSCVKVYKSEAVLLCCVKHGCRHVVDPSELGVMQRVFQADIAQLMGPWWREMEGGDGDAEREPSPFEKLRAKIDAFAMERSLMRDAGSRWVYKPVDGCPCAYEPYLSFGDFIRSVLRGDKLFLANVRRFTELEQYLDKYDEECFPRLVRDRDLLSFSNGVLVLSEARLVEYGSGECEEAFVGKGRVARHHIPLPFTGSVETPLMDSILERQFKEGDGRAEALYTLAGRLLFPVKSRDNWQVMPLLLGEAGTGKSTVLNVITRGAEPPLDPPSCGELSVFPGGFKGGGAPLQEQFQKMVAGERVHVSVKHGTAFTVQWAAPLVAAANVMFNYKDNAGQMSRRLAVFRFERIIGEAEADTTIEARILGGELPNVVAKCLRLYLSASAANGSKSFWAFCPPALKEAKEEAMALANYVTRFLTGGLDDNRSSTMRCYVRQVKGAVTAWADFKSAFDAYMRYKHAGAKWTLSTSEKGAFARLGYEVVKDNMCRSCGKAAVAGCCAEYSPANRAQRWRIHNMELVREALTDTHAPAAFYDDLEC